MPIVNAEVFENKKWLSKFQLGYKSCIGENDLINFLHELSREILRDPRSKNYPDLITVGFFCRKSSIQKILGAIPELGLRRGVGTVTHISPGNIPMNFAFSLFMGILSGNSNLVRLSTREFEQVDLFIEIFDQVCTKSNFQKFSSQTLFFKSDRNSSVLTDLIKKTDGLIVWGGDLTVDYFRSLPKAPKCVDVYFPNRVSSSLICAESVINCSAEEIQKLCLDFYNDTYLVDQNACSSPNHIVWLGSQSQCSEAKEIFWLNLNRRLQKNYQLDPVAKIDRILDVMDMTTCTQKDFELDRSYEDVWRHSEASLLQQKMRYGVFIESSALSLAGATSLFREVDQTLTVFGLQPDEIYHAFAQQNLYFDRIVAIGRALDMGIHWDGKNMLIQMSKQTQIG